MRLKSATNRPTGGIRKRMRVMAVCLFALPFLPFLASCNMIDKLLGKQEDDNRLEFLFFLLGSSATPADYYAKIYYIHPSITSAPTDRSLIWEATSADVAAGRKKLILVHGWHFDDRDFAGNYPSPDALKDRILAQNWSGFFGTTNYLAGVLSNYDVYAFDYLTAVGIDSNGARLRSRIDALFSPSDTVVLYGHSMGGLVSRFAVYQGADAGPIRRVITTGTPFHGSPWASPEFTDKSALGSLAAFYTDTEGGRDLGWDNYDGTSLPAASNPKLTAINALTSRDLLFYPYYGSLPSSAPPSHVLAAACAALGSGVPWEPSDCIVPKKSAMMDWHTTGITPRDWGAYDHLEMKMGSASQSPLPAQFIADLTSVP